MRFVMAKYLDNLFMSPKIVLFILLFKLHQGGQLVFMHFLFHLFPSHDGLFQFFGHSLLDFLFSPDFLLRNLNYSLKVDLNALNKIKLLLDLFVKFMNTVLINGCRRSICQNRLVLCCEIPQLLLVVNRHWCELFVQVPQKRISQLWSQWWIF